jgi:hypothetical protein
MLKQSQFIVLNKRLSKHQICILGTSRNLETRVGPKKKPAQKSQPENVTQNFVKKVGFFKLIVFGAFFGFPFFGICLFP